MIIYVDIYISNINVKYDVENAEVFSLRGSWFVGVCHARRSYLELKALATRPGHGDLFNCQTLTSNKKYIPSGYLT